MRRTRSTVPVALLAVGLAGAGVAAAAPAKVLPQTGAPKVPRGLHVLARSLDNPRSVAVGPNGAVFVAEAGHGQADANACQPDPDYATSCLGLTGAVTRITRAGRQRVLTGLPSLADHGGAGASGPAGIALDPKHQRMTVVIQWGSTRPDEVAAVGPKADLLGHPLTVSMPGKGSFRLKGPNIRGYEYDHNPDHGAGSEPGPAAEDSDPYAVATYGTGFVVADAGANDLFYVDQDSRLHLLAVFPTIAEHYADGSAAVAQSVPDAVTVGPDGAIYVGELTGFPFNTGKSRIWRVVPGHRPTVYASGFTAISSLAFDPQGRLLVLEIDTKHISDPSAPGALIRLDKEHRTRTVLAQRGLSFPTGVAVAPDGTIYIANHGSSPASGDGPHGELLSLRL
ncbi:MAG TPA: ScyD/ScyE family protein [Mycobacteriales bacterium]|nr:ScyD/ScyE family protein [Mycobacteriales bacterium]